MRVGDDFHIGFNSKLYEFLNDVDDVQRIMLRWLGHVVRMEEDIPRKGCLMRGSAEVGEEEDLLAVGKSK